MNFRVCSWFVEHAIGLREVCLCRAVRDTSGWLQVDILMADREKNIEAQDAAAKADPNAGVPAMQVCSPRGRQYCANFSI